MKKSNLREYIAPECEQYAVKNDSVIAQSGEMYLYQDYFGDEEF